MKPCNGVFEGGGVRGIGHVGAAWELERRGFSFVDLAGSSAGAMVAALLAAGYSSGELKEELESLDYMKFKGRDILDLLGTFGKMLSIWLHFGIYDTDYLEQWIWKLLDRKGIRVFDDVARLGRRLKITASDLTSKHLLILPDDLGELGLEPGAFPVALAVRMSVSIPVFFEPVRLKDRIGREHVIVDGGLLSNFPLWVLDDGSAGQVRPTLGFQFKSSQKENCTGSWGAPCPERWNLIDHLKAIVSTCMDATDQIHSLAGDPERTIRIPTEIDIDGEKKNVSAVDFNISREESRALFENGRKAAACFAEEWDFDKWERKYRREQKGML